MCFMLCEEMNDIVAKLCLVIPFDGDYFVTFGWSLILSTENKNLGKNCECAVISSDQILFNQIMARCFQLFSVVICRQNQGLVVGEDDEKRVSGLILIGLL